MNEQTPTNGQNPFNLIDQDIANQENNQGNVPAAQPTNNVAPAENTATTNTVDNQNTTPAAPKKDLFEEITWKVAKFFAKLMWQPDPETWATTAGTTATTNAQQPATNTENQWNTENTTPQKIDFNSVMSGVTGFMDKVWQSKIVWDMTWFLDKVWDKIWEKTGINLGTTPTTGNTENQNTAETPVETAQAETPTVQTETATPQPVETQAPVTQAETPAQPAEPVQPQTPVQQ